ncbi:hypothetical protein [Leifsonia sp. WHRI 6310E]|uniref:hypothetical protein n=1 Tax=Leifsonia sp. WHRI 6310E TaxID=3162562 RepID=UPI0032EB6A19
MSESIRFVDLIQSRIDGFFDVRASILVSIPDRGFLKGFSQRRQTVPRPFLLLGLAGGAHGR